MVEGEEAVPDSYGRVVRWLAAFFYDDNGILTLTRTERLQAVFDVLTGLFDRVGL